MKTCLMLVAGMFLIGQTVFAQDETNKLESWYTYWGIGYPAITYPSDLQAFVEELEDAPGVDRTRVGLDFLGFYFPVNQHKTAVGFVINTAADRFTYEGEWVQINQYIYGASVMHYVQGTIGKGLFLRGDVGLAKVVTQNSDGVSESSDDGFGFLVGGGYGLNITPGTRMLINVNYARRSIEGDASQVIGLSIGGLF